MDVWLAVVQFIHVLGGAAWLGGSVFANVILLPFVFRQPPDRRRELLRTLVLAPERLMIAAALIGGMAGIARGTLLGPIRSVADLGSRYGLIWVAAVFVVLGVFAVGGAVTSRAARRLIDDNALWLASADGRLAEGNASAVARLRLGFRIELGGILVALALMQALRVA